MKKKKNTKKAKKITVTLSYTDYERISALAKTQRVSRPLLAKRLLRAQLSALAVSSTKREAKNQLGLFDSMQLDIFNNTSKTEC